MYKRFRINKKDNKGNHERWLVSYADFITLLFAFFVVLYATSEKDRAKGKEFEQSVNKYLVKVGSGQNGADGGAPEKSKGQTLIKSPIESQDRQSAKAAKLLYKIETYIEDNLSPEEIEKIVSDISSEEVGVRISLDANKLFAKDSTKFNRSYLKTFNKIADALKITKHRIFVEAHSSDLPIPSSFASHWEFTAMRSSAVARYLTKVHKIDEDKIVSISYGSTKPVFSNKGSNSSKNDRLDFLIASDDFPL